jgi:hypothetical protein
LKNVAASIDATNSTGAAFASTLGSTGTSFGGVYGFPHALSGVSLNRPESYAQLHNRPCRSSAFVQ